MLGGLFRFFGGSEKPPPPLVPRSLGTNRATMRSRRPRSSQVLTLTRPKPTVVTLRHAEPPTKAKTKAKTKALQAINLDLAPIYLHNEVPDRTVSNGLVLSEVAPTLAPATMVLAEPPPAAQVLVEQAPATMVLVEQTPATQVLAEQTPATRSRKKRFRWRNENSPGATLSNVMVFNTSPVQDNSPRISKGSIVKLLMAAFVLIVGIVMLSLGLGNISVWIILIVLVVAAMGGGLWRLVR